MDNVPQHVSIIMDGNGRWAKARGKERVYGHMEGVESVRACTEAAVEAGGGSEPPDGTDDGSHPQ